MEEKSTEINIKKLRNGYLIKYYDYNEKENDYLWRELVIEEKEPNYNNARFNIPKEKVEAFQRVIELMEEVLGFDSWNKGDYVLKTKIEHIKDDEE